MGFGARHRKAGRVLTAAALAVTAGAWGLVDAAPASAAVPHVTTTSLDCPSTGTYGSPITCTVTVTDVNFLGSKASPTGTVSVGTILDRMDVSGSPCTLSPISGSKSSCTVTLTPTDIGHMAPGAIYNPTGNFLASLGADLFTAGRAPLTISADPQGATYGGPIPDLTASYSGFVLDDGPEDLTGTLACSTTATTSSPAGEYPISCEGLSSWVYDISWEPGTLTIAPAPLTVTADSGTRTYGATNPELGATFAGFVDGEGPEDLTGTLACSTTATTASAVGDYPVTCEGLSAANYALTWVPGNLAVTPASLTITARDAARVTGQANPPFEVGYSGFVNGDTKADLQGTLECGTPATASSPAGRYDIECEGLTSPNYGITWVDGTLDVQVAPAAVVADGSDLAPGGDLKLDSDGWKPDSTVTITVCGVEVGTAKADGNGALSTKVSLPADLPDGDCKVVLAGVDSAGGDYAVVLGVTLSRHANPDTPVSPIPAVPAAVAGVLPYTGVPAMAMVLTGLAALMVGAAMTTVQRRRAVVRVEQRRR